MAKKNVLGKGWSLLVLGAKFGKLLKSLSAAAKGLKAFGPLVSFGTMTISIWAYSYSLGWELAVMLVALLFVHEMGHVIACRNKGYKVKAPLFIPFLGALIFAPAGMDREEESYIGYGGPFLGSIGALFVWALWWILPSHPDVLLIAAYIGIFLNLFNLMPVSPLDGGRILQSVGPWIRWVGLSLLLVITIALQDVGWLFIWLLVLTDFRTSHRVPIMIFIWILMVVGYSMNVGVHAHWGIKLLHIFMGAAFVFLSWSQDMNPQEEVIRPPQPKNRARFWLTSYLVMAISLITLMAVISSQIAPIIEKSRSMDPAMSKIVQ